MIVSARIFYCFLMGMMAGTRAGAQPSAEAEQDMRASFPGHSITLQKFAVPCSSVTVAVFRVQGANSGKGEYRMWLNGRCLETSEIRPSLRKAYGWERPEGQAFLSKAVPPDEGEAIARRHAKRIYGSDRLGEAIPGYGPDGSTVVAHIFPVLLTPDASGTWNHIREWLAGNPPKNSHPYATVVVAANRHRPPFWHASAAAPDVLRAYDAAQTLARKSLGPDATYDRFYHFSSNRQFLRFVKGDKDVVVCALRGSALTPDEWTQEKQSGADEPLMPIDRLKDRWAKGGRPADTGGAP